MKYLFLALAIILEVTGSGFLKASEGFTKLVPTIAMAVAFLGCFYFLSLALKNIPLSTAYAIWAGAGIILTALISVLVFKQPIDMPAVIGILLIVSGVVVMNLCSKTAAH
ncbi:DMT family transporter [Edaphocola aurantiacus]|uniref:DMT family transporter n=1 Tax=Edaphocola aurantiacus TaxID=2601682 RepID=UPI001C950D42|nr:multidrug efflux SMR transporter [Edaphocola aurantiacus]